MTRIRVLLADDHAMLRAGLTIVLAAHRDIEVVAECEDGVRAVERAVELRPDVAVLDFAMPGLNGAEAAGRVHREAPEVRVLVLSAYEEQSYLRQVLQAGARGFVLKRAAAEDLVQAIRTVARGSVYLDPAFLGHVVDALSGEHAPVEATPTDRLSEREAEVLRPIAQGFSNKQVAARLRISPKTVETHKTRAMEKLGLRSRVELVQLARTSGWLSRG